MALRVLTICILASLLGGAKPSAPAAAVDRTVPRQVRVSFGEDHLFVSLRAVVRPEDFGQVDWSPWDKDGDGGVQAAEQQALVAALAQLVVGSLCVAVDGQLLVLSGPLLQHDGTAVASSDPQAKLVFRLEGTLALDRGRRSHQWVVYDRPGRAETYTSVSLASVPGLEFASVQGSVRAERRGTGRFEAVLSSLAPAVWGTQQRTP